MMGMLPLRACANSGCYTTRLPGSKFCAKHQNYAAQQDKQRKAANLLWRLYKCKRWLITRMHVLARDPICTWSGGCMALSTDCDHVVDAVLWIAQHDGDEMSFYDMDNLRGLCHSHHSQHTARTQGFASGKD